jgi:hypothetical protein
MPWPGMQDSAMMEPLMAGDLVLPSCFKCKTGGFQLNFHHFDCFALSYLGWFRTLLIHLTEEKYH